MAEPPTNTDQVQENIDSTNSVNWDVRGLYEGLPTTWAVDTTRAAHPGSDSNYLSALQFTGDTQGQQEKVRDRANELIFTNTNDRHPLSGLDGDQRTALDLQRLVRQQLRAGMAPQQLEESLKDLQGGWRVTFDRENNSFRIANSRDRVSSQVRVADVGLGNNETAQQAAARLAERMDVLSHNPDMMRAYMQGINQFLARTQMPPGEAADRYGREFIAAFRDRMRANPYLRNFDFGGIYENGKLMGVKMDKGFSSVYSERFPNSSDLREKIDEFKRTMTSLHSDVPPGTGLRILQSLEGDPSFMERLNTALNVQGTEMTTGEKIRRLHNLPAGASDQQVADAIEDNIRRHARRDQVEMRLQVNEQLKKEGKTLLAYDSTPEQVWNAMTELKGSGWQPTPPFNQDFDPRRMAGIYRIPGTSTVSTPDFYYCHGYTFGITGTDPNVLNEMQNYEPVPSGGEIRPGDIVIYRTEWDGKDHNWVTPHSGRVLNVTADGTVTMASKLGYGNLAIHHPLDRSLLRQFGPHVTFYRRRP